jgi:hypothetical protein
VRAVGLPAQRLHRAPHAQLLNCIALHAPSTTGRRRQFSVVWFVLSIQFNCSSISFQNEKKWHV